jgi:hypothetical protein
VNIISKVDGTPSAPRTKIAEELGIPVTTLHTVMYNRNKILKQSLTEQLNRKKILLFVDHCPAHPKDVRNFKNVQVEFFPANMTTVLQSMGQGVIRALKQKFIEALF